MKYYSEVTKNMYDSIEELEKAEKALSDKAAARKNDAAKVEEAFNNLVKARKEYAEQLESFCKKHGPYHTTLKGSEVDKTWKDLSQLVDLLF